MARKPKYYVRPDGLHETKRTITLPSGVKKRVPFRGHSDAEVDKKILQFTNTVERGRLFEVVAVEWEEEHFKTLATNTLKNYTPAYQRAVDHFAGKSAKDIKPSEINQFIVEFSKTRALKTVQTQLLILNLIFAHAAVAGDVDYNPCQNVRPPKNLSRKRREAPDAEQIEIVKKSVKDEFGLLPFFLLYTGLRMGECLALTWGDIDKKDNTIHVNKSVCFVGNQPHIKSPKTEAGNRDVILLDVLKKQLPKRGKPSEQVFKGNDGSILRETDFRRKWEAYQKRTGVTATPHQLRHAYATILFECGVGVKDAQDLLGHTTIAMTQDIYTHISKGRREQTALLINQKLAAQ